MKNGIIRSALAGAALGLALPAAAEPVARSLPAAGSVIARKSGEEVRFFDVSSWRHVDLAQDLLSGDVLRTNATGQLAVLFSDRTQVRLGRNTSLLVKQMANAENTSLELQSGTIWARAERGGQGLTVDTPAAAAAIRGTDWTLTVGADGKTSLIVLEGVVELSNAFGSVEVSQGEGAVAAIGKAPRKYILVDLKEREQVLLYSDLRGALSDLPISGLGTANARAERARILAIPDADRRDEDWLLLAEIALEHDGLKVAREALDGIRGPLQEPLKARATLVEAIIAGLETRYEEAANLFASAAPGLVADRRDAALHLRWFVEVLAYPDRQMEPPGRSGRHLTPTAALAMAIAAGHIGGQPEAIEMLRAAERRFPHDARLPAARANLAYQIDRREETIEALARARSIDPENPVYLLINARFRSTVYSDLDGALADLQRAAEQAPGIDAIWNEIGIVQSDRNAIVEADRAHSRAVELNPNNAVVRANYARFLIDNEQLSAAKSQIDGAEALDAQSYAVLAAKGRYLLRIGRTAEGEEALLQASAVNPTYGDSLIGVAIAAYQRNATDEAAQALDNADRFDPENPSVPLIRSGIALDSYEADQAIQNAREAVRRSLRRGGHYSGYDTNRQVSSYLGVALDNLGLTEWGQFYADKGFDPFQGSSYIDEAAAGRVSPFIATTPLMSPDQRVQSGASTEASKLQATLLDPLSLAGTGGRNSLEQIAFSEATLGTGIVLDDGKAGWTSDLLVQGTTFSPMPMSYYVQAQVERLDGPRENDEADLAGGLFQIGLHPTLQDRIYVFGSNIDVDTGFPGQAASPTLYDESKGRVSELGAGWSHTISDENILQSFIVGRDSDVTRTLNYSDSQGPFHIDDSIRDQSLTAGIGHMIGVGPFTLRYGTEFAASHFDQSLVYTDTPTGDVFFTDGSSGNGRAARAYGDIVWDLSDELQLQGGAHFTWFEGGDCGCVDPRIGLAWSPVDNHWLRAFYREDTQFLSNYTLSPISTVGFTPLDIPLFAGGQTKTSAVRWDAEWSERFFTSVEYQHQEIDGVSIDIPRLLESFSTIKGTIDSVNFSANYWIGSGLGAFGSVTWNQSRDTSGFFRGDFGLPLVPDYKAQVGLTYVHPSRVKVAVAQTFVGSRVGAPFGIEIEPYTTTDAAVSWKSESGHMEASLQLLNIFDNDFELALGIPGWGPTIKGAVKVRF